ncbi:hypothetical protein JL720_16532 [Aureococcus anophagefferens]|nr:hypothetical protein JL720_16532 [Aureococcus anophagefferens]
MENEAEAPRTMQEMEETLLLREEGCLKALQLDDAHALRRALAAAEIIDAKPPRFHDPSGAAPFLHEAAEPPRFHDPSGAAPFLHEAAALGSADCVRAMLAMGGGAVAAAFGGATPLQVACFFGPSVACAEALLAAGAALEVRGEPRRTPLDMARTAATAASRRRCSAGAASASRPSPTSRTRGASGPRPRTGSPGAASPPPGTSCSPSRARRLAAYSGAPRARVRRRPRRGAPPPPPPRRPPARRVLLGARGRPLD